MSDLDRILAAEELTLAKDKEIERVLLCHANDHFAVLELSPLVDLDGLSNRIKRVYRKKTLLLHPDKVKNPRAPDAFDRLKKAESVLMDEKSTERENLIKIYESVCGDKRETAFEHLTNVEIRKKVALVLAEQQNDEEIERKFAQRQEQLHQEEMKRLKEERELKKKLALQWEDERDKRVSNWRQYTNKVSKKKKKKRNVLA